MMALIPSTTEAEHELSQEDIILISAGTIATYLSGTLIRKIDLSRHSILPGPLPFEKKIQKLIAGDYTIGQKNFLDDTLGASITPIICGLLLVTADMGWESNDKGNRTLQDIFLFGTGLAATKGLTDIFKGLIARERPFPRFYPELATKRSNIDYGFDHRSFFSFHTSGAFYASSFLNKRTRAIMRSEMSALRYRKYRWLSPTILFGWSSYVGLSRVRAYKHYISDVIVGAVAGHLMSELFSSFVKYEKNHEPTYFINPAFKLTLRF